MVYGEDTHVGTPPPVVKDEPELLILTQLLEYLYMEDSSGRKWKPTVPTWKICHRIQITPREWDVDMPMEPQPIEKLPRTAGRISPNPDLDTHVEILEFVEEEDQNNRTVSIK